MSGVAPLTNPVVVRLVAAVMVLALDIQLIEQVVECFVIDYVHGHSEIDPMLRWTGARARSAKLPDEISFDGILTSDSLCRDALHDG